MALPINSLNDSGLAALAGQRVGALPLQVTPVDLGAPQTGTALGMIKAQQQKFEMAQIQAKAQGEIGVAQQQGQNQLATQSLQNAGQQQLQQSQQGFEQPFKQQEQATNLQAVQQQGQFQQGQLQQGQQQIKQQGQIAQGQLGVAQQQANTQQAQQQQEAVMQNLSARMAMKSYELKQRGAAASALLIGYNQYQGQPDKQQQYAQMMIPHLVQDGSMSQTEADELSQLPVDQQRGLLAHDLMMSGAAQDGKDSGLTSLPGMNNSAFGPTALGTKAQSDNQNLQMETQRSLMDSTALLTNFDSNNFTTGGQAQGLWGQVIGKMPQAVQDALPGTQEAKDRAASIDAYKGNVLQSLMSTLAQQKGVRFNKMTIDSLKAEMPTPAIGPLEGDSPEQAFAKSVTLYQRMQRANDFANSLSQQGLTPNSTTYQDKINNFIQNDQTPGKLTVQLPDGKQHTLGLKDIQAFATANKMTEGQAIGHFLTMQPSSSTAPLTSQATNQTTQQGL